MPCVASVSTLETIAMGVSTIFSPLILLGSGSKHYIISETLTHKKKKTPARPDRHGGSVPATPSSQGLQLQQDVGKKAASPRTQDQTTNASDSLLRPDRTVIEKYIQGMAALAFTETGKQKLSQLYDSAATPNQPVHPFLGDEDILTLALRDTAASEPAIRKGLHVLQTIPSVLKDGRLKQMVLQLPSAQPGPINIGQTLVGGSTRAGVLSSDQEHLNAKAGTDQTVRPNGSEKAGCAPGPDPLVVMLMGMKSHKSCVTVEVAEIECGTGAAVASVTFCQ
ncbi:TPA: hypothetical protein ACH3X1_007592 [Trebouxia sp. C0004]